MRRISLLASLLPAIFSEIHRLISQGLKNNPSLFRDNVHLRNSQMRRTPTNIGLCNVFFYVLLPVSLCAAILFRYDFIGIVYLLLLLTWPYNTGYNTAYAKRFTLTTLIFSCIFSLLECIFLAVVALKNTDFLDRDPDWELGYCSKPEEVYRFLGMQALDQANAMNIIRILVPNFVVFIISLLTYLNLCAIKAKGSHQGSQETQLIPGNPGQSQTFLGETITDQTLETKSRWNKFLFLFTLVFLALSGIASPSALSFPYLLLFLFLTTMYSFHVNLEPQRNVYKLRLGLSIYTAFHLLLMYMWQLPSINSNSMEINKETNATDLASRVLGLKRLVIVDCTIPNPCGTNTTINNITTVRPVSVYDVVVDNCVHEDCVKPYCWQNETPDFFEPMFVLLLHFCCAYSYMIFRDFKSSQKAYYSHLSQRSAAYIQEADPLVDATSTFSDTEVAQDSAYPVPEPSAKSPTSAVLHRMSIFKSRLPQKRQIWIALREKVLYVVGLIMMMAWSVTYHSWITFILLLWSCYLWMARDRASVTLRHSKYITLYAIVLILLQFVYSLRLTDDELPTKLHDNDKGEKASDGLKTIGLRNQSLTIFSPVLSSSQTSSSSSIS
jgi:piezo-type mechanosensitive ion channel component 1/2